MATVAAVIASTHHPFYYRASTSVGPDRPPFADEWVAKIERFRETLARDPWSGTHLVVASIEPWTIRLDARESEPAR